MQQALSSSSLTMTGSILESFSVACPMGQRTNQHDRCESPPWVCVDVRGALLCRYVYQKAYVEFFCSPENFAQLEARLRGKKTLTYMAVNSAGDVRSNVAHTDVNAVTWGVFPAKEVVQPTVVDPQSFSVWKVRPRWRNCRLW